MGAPSPTPRTRRRTISRKCRWSIAGAWRSPRRGDCWSIDGAPRAPPRRLATAELDAPLHRVARDGAPELPPGRAVAQREVDLLATHPPHGHLERLLARGCAAAQRLVGLPEHEIVRLRAVDLHLPAP